MNPPTVAVICTTCWRLRCTGGHVDYCDCTYPHGVERDVSQVERELACDLCYACGLGVARGHTRWHSLLCDHCRPLARALNQERGTLVVPMGIHSMVNGIAYSPKPKAPPKVTLAELSDFTDGLKASVGLIGAAATYGKQVVRDRCEQLGLARGGDIPLGEYLVVAINAWHTPEQAWHDLVRKLDGQTADGSA